MKQRFRVFRRPWGVYYCQDLTTGKQESLKTRDREEAFRLVAARNETEQAPAFNLHLAWVYWRAGDPQAATRTWQLVMEEIPKLKQGNTRARWLCASLPEPEFESRTNSFRTVFRKAMPVEKRFAGLGLNERQWQAVRQATEKGRFTLADYAGLVDMPSRTLQRDLKDLVGKGVFVKRGTARATWYEVKR